MPFTVYVIEIIVSYKIKKIQISNGVKTTIRSRLNNYYKMFVNIITCCKNEFLL